ncbi:YybH family protein [Bacteroidota bacterium]
MRKLSVICIVLLIGVTQLYSQDAGEIKAKIKKMNAKFSKLMLEDNFEEMMKFYSDDIISMPSYQPMLRGADAMVKAHDMQKESGVKITAFELKTSDVIAAGDYFIEIGMYTITMTIPNMKMPWSDNGKYLNVWTMSDEGNMELAIETWNTDVNPWIEMQKMEESDPVEYGNPEIMKEKETKEVK